MCLSTIWNRQNITYRSKYNYHKKTSMRPHLCVCYNLEWLNKYSLWKYPQTFEACFIRNININVIMRPVHRPCRWLRWALLSHKTQTVLPEKINETFFLILKFFNEMKLKTFLYQQTCSILSFANQGKLVIVTHSNCTTP